MITEKQADLLMRASSGKLYTSSSVSKRTDFDTLVLLGCIACVNFGHFTPTIFLTEKGYAALEEYYFENQELPCQKS